MSVPDDNVKVFTHPRLNSWLSRYIGNVAGEAPFGLAIVHLAVWHKNPVVGCANDA